MKIGIAINKLRNEAKLTQAQFAEIFGVSQQSVQKWESGLSTPDLEKIILISKYFDVSLDALVLGNDTRVVEEMSKTRVIKPQYQNIHDWEFYSSNLLIEYQQSIEEGLDVEKYRDIFSSVSRLPKSEIKKKFGDILFEIIASATTKKEYPYVEPSEIEKIKSLRNHVEVIRDYDEKALEDKIHGAWMGRICGCMLGKTVEGIRTNELIPFLKETNNYPMRRYIYRSDLTNETISKYKFGFMGRCYIDEINGMPVDDDTNYVVLAQELIQKYGKNFTSYDVANVWLKYQGKDAYCTAERVAYCNFVKGFAPPESAVYKNPYREWIGAQIRGDYFGYINPGNPELAAEMAWRDASISHIKNGIYGEMFVAAMLAIAACTSNIEDIILGGLAEIPSTSRLYEDVMHVVEIFKSGVSQQKCFEMIHDKYDEYTAHGWCHTISNAMIVVASLLYGKGDYGNSICMAVETGFDTDCNGATVGSVLGMANGIQSIPEYWTKPINDTLHTSIFGIDTVKISDCVKLTMEHIAK
ncbi:MAG: helix-turn-helix domain-containing protein [Clostridiales bacterium]|nr:helix-turn-helix domain-containing protein [Clostridiales bacterium]